MNKKDVESKMWVWNFCVSTFKHDRPCSKNEILENLGKYSNSTLQSVSFKKTSNKYFFTYATFFDNFLRLRSFKPTLHVNCSYLYTKRCGTFWIKGWIKPLGIKNLTVQFTSNATRLNSISLFWPNSETGILRGPRFQNFCQSADRLVRAD